MKERPMLFSSAMVRALLADKKTQTRRIIKHQPERVVVPGIGPMLAIQQPRGENRWLWPNAKAEVIASCPYGQPGDLLWVRESFAHVYRGNARPNARSPDDVAYMADGMMLDQDVYGTWKPSIHMPRWASRITLELTDVRLERLNNISESDCWAEGIEEVMHDFDDASQADMAKRLGCCIEDAKPLYAQLWEQINGIGSWGANPLVWVVEFRKALQ